MNHSSELQFAVTIAEAAATILEDFFQRELTQTIKSSEEDFFTEADITSEKFILEAIRSQFPNDSILAEESGADTSGTSEYTWIVDPLDGTCNFANGIEDFGVLIARARGREIELGVNVLPKRKESIAAEIGKGVWKNGEQVQVEHPKQLKDSKVLMGWWLSDSDADLLERLRLEWKKKGLEPTSLRSAAANGAELLKGEYSSYIGSSFHPWDFAALQPILGEAGFLMTQLSGEPIDWRNGNQNFLAAPKVLHAPIIEQIAEV